MKPPNPIDNVSQYAYWPSELDLHILYEFGRCTNQQAWLYCKHMNPSLIYQAVD